MTQESFCQYALSPRLTADEIYTIELLIDRVQSRFDPGYWDNDRARSDERDRRNYRPRFLKEHVEPAAGELQKITWLSLQRLNSGRPVRDLTAFKHLQNLSTLVLSDNEVSDLSPLGACPQLRELILSGNPLRDLGPLAKCSKLERLDIHGLPARNLTVLQQLPKLRELTLLIRQLPAFKKLQLLPNLRKLDFALEIGKRFKSFEGFPHMPELRTICSAKVQSLKGIEKFSKLENLTNFDGDVDSLEPLRHLKSLTHINISSKVKSLEPLAGLEQLRYLGLSIRTNDLSLQPLRDLPRLHDIWIGGRDVGAPIGLDELRATLTTWDSEFLTAAPRYTPNLAIEIVDQTTFDYFDSHPYNKSDNENESLLSSELDWLDEKLEAFFGARLEDGTDYTIPYKWPGSRSRTIVLYSNQAVEKFMDLVLGIQRVLAHCQNDWIIYFQTDGTEKQFVVWVYPEKVVTTSEYAEVVRDLTSGVV